MRWEICVCVSFVSQKTILSVFYQVYTKRSEGVEPEEKNRNAPMVKKRLLFINIHKVRYHSGARHQSQEVVKSVFLISSRLHSSLFFYPLHSWSLYLFPWITLCLSRGISVWMCTTGRFTRWETWTDLSSLCTHFHLHSRGRTRLDKLPQRLVSHTHIQMLSAARLWSWIYVCVYKPQTSSQANFYADL